MRLLFSQGGSSPFLALKFSPMILRIFRYNNNLLMLVDCYRQLKRIYKITGIETHQLAELNSIIIYKTS